MRTIHQLALLTAVVSLVACSSSDDMALLHREITDVQRTVDNLQTEVIDQSDLKAMEKSMQDLTNQIFVQIILFLQLSILQRLILLKEQVYGQS